MGQTPSESPDHFLFFFFFFFPVLSLHRGHDILHGCGIRGTLITHMGHCSFKQFYHYTGTYIVAYGSASTRETAPVTHCLLPTVCCPLSAARCLLPTVYCPLSARSVCSLCLLPAVCCPLSAAHCLLPTVCYSLSAAHCLLPTACPLCLPALSAPSVCTH
jgi:hypothetical protein